MNPLDKYPAVRAALYLIQWIASGVLLVTSAVVLAVTDGSAPLWLTATTVGFNAFTAYTGLTAQVNTGVSRNPANDTDEYDVLADYDSVDEGTEEG